MTIYEEEDIYYGAGALDQAARLSGIIPGRSARLTSGPSVGILSAAMRSGVPAGLLSQMIEKQFADSAPLLNRVLAMYEGNDWSINLWHLLPSGQYKLCTDLCRPKLIHWRCDRSASQSDF